MAQDPADVAVLDLTQAGHAAHLHDLQAFLGVAPSTIVAATVEHRQGSPGQLRVTLGAPDNHRVSLRIFASAPNVPAWLSGPLLSVAYQLLENSENPFAIKDVSALLGEVAAAVKAAKSGPQSPAGGLQELLRDPMQGPVSEAELTGQPSLESSAPRQGWRRLFSHFHRGSCTAPEHAVAEAAWHLGVFDWLLRQTQPLPAEAAAQALGAQLDGLTLVLKALAALGFVEESPSGFVLEAGPRTQLQNNRSILAWRMQEAARWHALAARVKQGRTQDTVMAGDQTALWLDAIGETQESSLEAEVRALGLRGDERLLDVGSGGGRYAAEFLRLYPKMTVALVDYRQSLPAARDHLRQQQQLDRAVFIEAEFFEPTWLPASDFSLAWLSGVVHSAGPVANSSLLSRLYAALPVGGRVMVLEQPAEPSISKRMNALNYYVMSSTAQAYTAQELKSLLAHAGFGDIHVQAPGWASVFVGTKLK